MSEITSEMVESRSEAAAKLLAIADAPGPNSLSAVKSYFFTRSGDSFLLCPSISANGRAISEKFAVV